MSYRVRSAFGRFLALSVVAMIAVFVAVAPAAAQQTSGKIEGTVTDQAGVPLANAQVFVVGTSFGAITNDKGYFFINNVPVGGYTIRAQFIGYAPSEQRETRVFGGQTITVNVKLTPSAIQVGTISVTASNPIVPRDQVTSKSIISGADINKLPIDDVRNIISVQPGVVESGAGMGLVIRGGRPGEANVYIDGVPVRSANSGGQAITVGTNAVEEASVTTGALGVEFGDAQSGIISYTTRSGGERLGGSLSYATDEPFGNSISVGFNRFEGSIGGPIPIVNNLRFFLSGVVQGQQSRFQGKGADSVPTYVVSGIDTTVTVGTETVNVLGFDQFSGDCATCQGRRLPTDWTTSVSTTAKLTYSYGSGSSVWLTGLASGDQGRFFPGVNAGNPLLHRGFHNWARLAILNVNHSFFKSAERELALNVNLSWARNDSLNGPLDPTTELATRQPGMGLEFSPLNFAGFGDLPTPITEDIVRNIRSNTGLRVPLAGRDDLRNRQPYRMNPYGLVSGGWSTDGFDAASTVLQETRLRGFAQVDWQANRFHRFNFGGELKKVDLAYWSSSQIRQIFMDAYVVNPVTYAVWGMDRLDLVTWCSSSACGMTTWTRRRCSPIRRAASSRTRRMGRPRTMTRRWQPCSRPPKRTARCRRACGCRSRSPNGRISGCPTHTR